mmetsp:Transcript_18541/g.35708  ORF Transcript_18541/g.35708 Transcript_18541/m.35708 type:complete len:243 (-) Transcript_18541:414-1142(-)
MGAIVCFEDSSKHSKTGTWFQGRHFTGTLDSDGRNSAGRVQFEVHMSSRRFRLSSRCKETSWSRYYQSINRISRSKVRRKRSTVELSGNLDVDPAFEAKEGQVIIPMICSVTRASVAVQNSHKNTKVEMSVLTRHEFARLISVLSNGTGSVVHVLQPLVLEYIGVDYLLSVGKILQNFAISTLRFSVNFTIRNEKERRKGKTHATVVPIPRSGDAFVENIKTRINNPEALPLPLFPLRVLTY